VSLRSPLAPLRPGDLIAVVAPASPFDREELMRGLAWLRTRYRLRLSASILSRHGYLAGTDERRATELTRAMTDPDVGAIFCARGGYGAMRLLDALPWDAFAARPKWLVGFSDITALHVVANGRGIPTVHGPNVTGLGRSISPYERMALLDTIEGRASGASWRGLSIVHAGPAPASATEGVLYGGNLALVEAMASSARLAVPEGAVLVLEDVTERPYRIDRMLTALRLGGHLARASAIVFGGFTQCEPGADGVTYDTVIAERTADLGVPVLAGAPFGHGRPNDAFMLGARVRVSGADVVPA